MIDYDKLKTAHELAYKLCEQTGMRVDIVLCWVDSEFPDYILMDYTSDKEYLFGTVEGLIEELTELTKPEPKHKVGDEVWTCRETDTDYQPELLTIHGVMTAGYILTDGEQLFYIPERHLYLTKESLIAAQIAHWQSLSKPEECQHEIKLDPIIYFSESLGGLYDR